MIRCSAVSSFAGPTVFTLTDLLNKTLGPRVEPPAPAVPSFSALEPLLLVLTSPKLNLCSSGDSLLAEDGTRRMGRRTTGTAESGMRRMLLQGRVRRN